MSVKDYARYIINNINRAVIGNALKISDKIDVSGGYQFIEILNEIKIYLVEMTEKGLIDSDKCYSIYHIVNNSMKQYTNNSIKYNKRYIINDFIIFILIKIKFIKSFFCFILT